MKHTAFSLAIRQLRQDFRNPNVLIALAAVGVITGLSGPFDTMRVMPAMPRIAYWLIVIALTYAIGNAISKTCDQVFSILPVWQRLTLNTVLIGTVITLVLLVLNYAVFDFLPDGPFQVIRFFVLTLLISAVIVVGFYLTQTKSSGASPAILSRLPFDKRGPLICLTAHDHYVEVVTTKGNVEILMRLSDAIPETGERGLQVHRSHWVGIDQVVSATRKGDRAILTMSDGRKVPVSRSYVPAARKAGLLTC